MDLNLIQIMIDSFMIMGQTIYASIEHIIPLVVPIIGILIGAKIAVYFFDRNINATIERNEGYAYHQAGGKYSDEVSFMDSDNARDIDDNFERSRIEALRQEYGYSGHPDSDWLDEDREEGW